MTASHIDPEGSEVEDELRSLEVSAPAPRILEENEDDTEPMTMSDDNNNSTQVYGPPPHIAARFHRPNMNRRRSSAPSSRRNSLSSSHSKASTRTYYRTRYQSNSIAQHLRRTSIIESRKARLADKAVHAEQVRLRAAMAKATPRVTNTEERALAAQQAREKLLAKVAAACADEVNRAKRIAEEAKERKAAEEKRARAEIEEKHIEAEKRRQEYLKTIRKPRTTSLPTGAEGKRSPESAQRKTSPELAARRIQAAWRRASRQRLVKKFLGLGLSIDRVWNTSFEDATALLNEEEVISATAKLMQVLQLDTGTKGDETAIRSFLSAYMILGHATDVFNRHGSQEEDLIGKAKELLISFEAILSDMTSTDTCRSSSSQIQTLSQAYAAYSTGFESWKKRDASALIETMIDQFVALDGIWQTVKDDTRGDVANDYREGIREQQILLLSKIKKLAGAERANTMIKRAIRESRRSRTRSRPVEEVRPREVHGSEQASTQNSSEAVAGESEQQTESSEGPLETAELSRVFSVVPPNRVLVHELLLDPTFRISPSPNNDPRQALNREVCESMRRAVKDGDGTIWTVAVAENIRSRLLKLLKQGNSLHTLISEVLDSNYIRQQCDQNTFSYGKFFEWMADLLPRLCAPIRDDEVKRLSDSLKEPSESTDIMIEKLFGLLHVIDLMSLDYTNYMLQQAAPTLIQEAAGYEQRMFATDLQSGAVTLDRTKRWWKHASLNAVTEQAGPLGLNTLPPPSSSSATMNHIYARAVSDLAISPSPLNPADIPETLYLDSARLARIRSETLRVVFVGAVLTTAKNLLKRDVRSQWKPEAKRIYDLLAQHQSYFTSETDLGSQIPSILTSSHPMPATSLTQLTNHTRRFLHECGEGRLENPLLKLLFKRLKGHFFSRLEATGGSSQERVRVASSAGEILAGIGLAEFIGQVGGVAEELGRIRQIDLDAHNGWYTQVTREIEEGEDREIVQEQQNSSQNQEAAS